MADFGYYLFGQKTSALTLSDATTNCYRKELIYCGNFSKPNADGTEQPFTVTLERLQHWKTQGELMLANGVDIPVPADHTTSPDKKRGKIVGYEIGKNDKGVDALFGLVEFNDAKTAEQNKHNNVSIYAQSEFKDGKKNTYVDAIRHVALTDYPVIPGLGKFDLVLSFTEPGNQNMDKLATLLGIDPKDPDIETKIFDAVKALVGDEKKEPADPNDPADKNIPPGAKAGANANPPALSLSMPVAKTMANMVIGSRTMAIDALVGTHFNPAAAKLLKDQYCNSDALSLSLSTTGDVDNSAFDTMIKVAKANGPTMKLGEKTGAQLPDSLELSGADLINVEKNPLLASAERIAKAAKR